MNRILEWSVHVSLKTNWLSLPTTRKKKIPVITYDSASGITDEPIVPCGNISLIMVCRLVVVFQAVKNYTWIGRTMNATNMYYINLLLNFNIEWDTYDELKKQDDPDVPLNNENDNYRRLIMWVSFFTDCLSQTYGSRGPLVYVLW